MCDILKTAGHRAKLKFGTSSGDSSNTYVDLVVFNVILGAFSALISKWPVTRKQLVI